MPEEYEKLQDQVFRIFPADPVLQKAAAETFYKKKVEAHIHKFGINLHFIVL